MNLSALKIFGSRHLDKILWLLLILVFAISYFRVPFIFFQQDEIFSIGVYIRDGINTLNFLKVFRNLDHLAPITTTLAYGIYSFWGLNYHIYNLIGILIHLVNGLLIYWISKEIFKSKNYAILTAIVFFSASQAHEIIMWPGASLNTLSLTFSLLAIGVLIKKISQHDRLNIGESLLVSLLFLCAVFSIEYAISLVLFVPLALFVLCKSKKNAFFSLIPFGFIVAVYLFWRFIPVITAGQASRASSVSSTRLGRLVSLPLVYYGQLFLGQDVPLGVSKIISSVYFKNLQDPKFAENVIYRPVTISFSLIVLVMTIVIYLKARSKFTEQIKYFLIFFSFIVFNALPFVLVPESASAIIPSRYLYFGIVSYSFMFVLICYFLKRSSKLKTVIIFLVTFLAIISGVYLNYRISSNLYFTGEVRLRVLKKMQSLYPKLPTKTVFYTESDRTFFGLQPEERILPFQSGLGQTLLVWYQMTEKYPTIFFANRYLWEITDQGYKESEGRGFGYFRDFTELTDAVSKNNLDQSNIIGFRFDSSTNQIFDNTDEIRGRVAGYLAEKMFIQNDEFTLSASENNKDIGKAKDGSRSTFWQSKQPYSYRQSIVVEFNQPRKIAEVVIDSYGDRNQNEVGYAIHISGDKKNWQRIFYAKRYPPNDSGLVELYFQPSQASYLKIEQVGYHKYVPWVINELAVFESR